MMDVDPKKLRSITPKLMRRKPRGTIRNKPCWCQSGRKFKRCHGFPSSGQGSAGSLTQASAPSLKDEQHG